MQFNPAQQSSSSRGNLITSLTFSGRTIVNVSSVDVPTNTFTAIGHGLSNGMVIHPTLNDNAGAVYLPNVITGGVSPATRYYVINATTDTFQLSLSSGGTSITLSTNANMNLSKFHFEAASTESTTLEITGLSPKKRYKAILKGKILRNDIFYCQPSNWGNPGDTGWLASGRSSFTTGYLAGNTGNVLVYAELLFDSTAIGGVIRADGVHIKTNSTTANTWTAITDTLYNPVYTNVDITAVKAQVGGGFANGTTLEVYEV